MDISLYLLKNYSNYFNKKVRRKTSLNAYLGAVEDSFELKSTDFNPNDGVATTHVVGSASSPYEPTWNPDYVIVVDKDDNDKIISRWFVTEFRRNMINQYTISLKRDVISDFYESCINSPCFIEKAHLNDNDPMIVNSEGMSLNQIKTNEYYLKDKTKVPWIVVYLAQKKSDGNDRDNWNNISSGYLPIDKKDLPHIEDDPDMSALFIGSGGALSLNATKTKISRVVTIFKYETHKGLSAWHWGSIFNEQNNEYGYKDWSVKPQVELTMYNPKDWDNEEQFKIWLKDIGRKFKSNGYISAIKNTEFASINYGLYDKAPNPQTKKFWYYQGHVYQLRINKSKETLPTRIINNSSCNNPFREAMIEILKGSDTRFFDTPPFIGCEVDRETITYTLTENISNEIYGSVKKNNNHCLDVPYDIIAMPFGEIEIKNHPTTLTGTYISEPFAALNFARTLAIGGKLTGDIVFGTNQYIYDVQILPYCPLANDNIIVDGSIDLSKGTEHGNYELITDSPSSPTKIVSIMLFSSFATNTFDIDTLGLDLFKGEEINVSDILKIDNRKIQNECDMFRLVSPNYNGMFDFNISKCIYLDKTSIDKFNVDIVYRPYNPYIHINPDFGFLYGEDYNDSRGLICGGDYSITIVGSAWTTYELNNKNYQNIFDRQISHMETDFAINQKRQDFNFLIGAIASALNTTNASMAAGIGGAVSQNPMGYIAAGTIATRGAINQGSGLASWLTNRGLNREQLNENISYSRDMFNMQLDNIKALPQSLTKSSSLSYNYKFFPILEYYTCTEEEKSALINKIKYNGMTVGRIDKISNYISNDEERFIKGQMIRIEGIDEDSHIAMEIYNVINSGVFFTPEGE